MKRVKKIKEYYNKNMENAEKDYEILGWESQEAQYARFAALKDNIDMEGLKLLDVGCGLGNLLEYLTGEGVKVQYTGVDILPEMIEMAKKKNLDGEFICTDVFTDKSFTTDSFDVVYASGIFNLNLENNREFLLSALGHFFNISKKYICFNLLHYKSPNKEDTYFYFSPDEARAIISDASAGSKISIDIVEDYLKNDFTVLCKKL